MTSLMSWPNIFIKVLTVSVYQTFDLSNNFYYVVVYLLNIYFFSLSSLRDVYYLINNVWEMFTIHLYEEKKIV